MDEIAVRGRPFQPGVSGNPNGRPVGSRTAFSAAFMRDLAETWAEHGKDTMLHTAKLNPEVFFATCARLIPKDVQLSIQQHYSSNLDHADLEILRAIKQAIPDADQCQPSEVFDLVLEAVRAHNAKLITAK
jgi:hypothetical protein